MRKERVLVLMHPDLLPPDSREGFSEQQQDEWKTEFDVVTTLRGLGHEVQPLGVQDELRPVREAIETWHPTIVFNLLEEFHRNVLYDQNVVSYLELLQVPYTGCNPRGLVIARSKALCKKLLAYHRINVPEFSVFPLNRAVRRPRKLPFPLIVKSLTEHGSLGISQASIVDSDEKLEERVAFVHERVKTDAIAEQFIQGREYYVSILGNERLLALPVWELVFENMPANAALIATEKVKHDVAYQKRRGIFQQVAQDLPNGMEARIIRTSKRIYRLLELDGYARIDYRLSADGTLYFLDANPNPEIAESEEFAMAAKHVGITYPELLTRVINLGIRRHA
ncbi:MAG TPA: ATP-grasp domain-containing protein [Gemmatimonadaceae bacterium]|nr:ATP-grasp domain-containing protein [Gemmatimonadaceae bacterium]